MAAMRGHLLVGLLLMYVGLDFANPMMPGAVSFDPSECVEGVHLERARTPESTASVPVLPVARRIDTASAERAAPRSVRNPRPPLFFVTPPAHAVPLDAPPPGDDH